MIISLFGALLTTLAQAVIFSRAEVKTWLDGLKIAAFIWLGFVAVIGMDTVLYEERKYLLYQINSSYHLVGLLVAGAILAVWKKKE